MAGSVILSCSGKLCSSSVLPRARGSLGRGRVAVQCRATNARSGVPKDQPDTVALAVGRRGVVSALLAGALLLPAGASLAEEADLAPQAGTDVSVAEEVIIAPQDSTEAPLAGEADLAPEATSSEVAIAEAADVAPEASTSGNETVAASGPTKVFMDVNIDGNPAGRIAIELFTDVAAGSSRFAELAAGRQGVDYRLSKFNGVLPTYIRNAGLNRLSYSATESSPITEGDSVESLEDELDKQVRRHDQAGLVSLIVREKEARPVKERLVARDGKLITVLEQAGEAPNGTQFTITTAASPELDGTNLIIGRVVAGEELLRRISALPVNRPRNDNPYFVAGKAMGDKRAVTAERAFYRPFQKVVVSGSGILE